MCLLPTTTLSIGYWQTELIKTHAETVVVTQR
jgi:hypothetical protein